MILQRAKLDEFLTSFLLLGISIQSYHVMQQEPEIWELVLQFPDPVSLNLCWAGENNRLENPRSRLHRLFALLKTMVDVYDLAVTVMVGKKEQFMLCPSRLNAYITWGESYRSFD